MIFFRTEVSDSLVSFLVCKHGLHQLFLFQVFHSDKKIALLDFLDDDMKSSKRRKNLLRSTSRGPNKGCFLDVNYTLLCETC